MGDRSIIETPVVPMRAVTEQDIRLDATAGDVAPLQRIAESLKRGRLEETLLAIHQRLKSICVPDSQAFWNSPLRGRRTSTDMLSPETAWGCSAHVQVACHLARACAIPAILVKTLSVRWIQHENRGDGRGNGHVYVEVLAHGKPCLWDWQGGRLHADYNGKTEVVEGRRIYQKGDPEELILSHHGLEWEAETTRLFPQAGRGW